MSGLYGPWSDIETGYEIFEDDGWHWRWVEPGEPDDFSSAFDLESEAYRDAARDWDENGCGVPRLTGTLKALATKLERAGR
ncbi:Uncharacterised protein [Mycobacteroides abscessus subsp. bolletii]|uniref:hypothetical protein n=1 Tax=Mycobacteroides abscessus TaxID=36809 RepID=UPI0009A569B3|nr:hypothetical protein [Mycobacteroides abscessus]SLF32853.1 Uncharacterised protein [Mycobacteroides abscessus subsp. bolletii]